MNVDFPTINQSGRIGDKSLIVQEGDIKRIEKGVSIKKMKEGDGLMNNTRLTDNRICTILREKLYTMTDNENESVYEPLQLNWTLPIDSPQGMITAFQNIFFLLDYVHKRACSKSVVDEIIKNDIYPVTNAIGNEYAFIISGTLIAICSVVDDFSDQDELMEWVYEIIGKFIYLLEVSREKFDSKKADSTNEKEIVHGIDTTGLELGMVVKNYKEMCKMLDEEVTNGNSKKAQLKEWARYFEWEKSGQKFIITDIYDTPLNRQDKRKIGNNSVYVKYIELILLQYLSKQKEYTKTFTKRNWWELLGMVNRNYNRVSKKYLENIDHSITKFEINHFYQRCNKKLEQILFSSLNNLKSRKLLIWEMETVIVIKDNCGENFILANDEQKKLILEVERYILKNVMGYEKIFQVFCHFKQEEYYRKVNEKLYELYGWDHYFKQIKMIYTQSSILEAVEQSKVDLQKAILNEKIIKVLNNNAEEKYNTDKQEWEEYKNNLIWGEFDISLKNAWNIPDTYLEAQRILTEELINIGHKNKRILLDQFEDENELSQLFTTFMY